MEIRHTTKTWDVSLHKWVKRAPRLLTKDERMHETRRQMLEFFAGRESARLDEVVRPWDMQQTKFASGFFADMRAGKKSLGLKMRGPYSESGIRLSEHNLRADMWDRAMVKGAKKAEKLLGPRPAQGHIGDVGEEFGFGYDFYNIRSIATAMAKKAGMSTKDIAEIL